MDHLFQSVHKSYAYHVADFIDSKTKHEFQVQQLWDMLKQDPNNQQAMDELMKAADQGSEKAKVAIESLQKPLTIVPPPAS